VLFRSDEGDEQTVAISCDIGMEDEDDDDDGDGDEREAEDMLFENWNEAPVVQIGKLAID
jgi:hypothetical protein